MVAIVKPGNKLEMCKKCLILQHINFKIKNSMLELDPKKLREIESDCFKEAKRNTPTKDMDQYAEILLKFVAQVFVSHFMPRLHRNKEIAANAKKMDFETVYATLLERHGKYADVEKDSRGFDYL